MRHLVEPAAVHILLELAIPLIGDALLQSLHQLHHLILGEAVDGLFDFQ